MSTTPPMHEHDFNALDFSRRCRRLPRFPAKMTLVPEYWEDLVRVVVLFRYNRNSLINICGGQEIFVKSNVNNWLVCSPNGGSFVDWTPGKISCKIANKIAGTHCTDWSPSVKILFKDCGPQLLRGNKNYYFFVSCTNVNDRWPIHDPCAKNQENQLRDVQDPHGNIFVRWEELPRRTRLQIAVCTKYNFRAVV